MSRDGRRKNPAARHGARGPDDRPGAAPGGYGGSDPYGSQDPYAAGNGYGGPDDYAAPAGYGPADGYQAADRYGQPDAYGREQYADDGYSQNGYTPDGYAGSDGYVSSDGYAGDGYGSGSYAASDGYAPPDRYAPSGGFAAPGGYGQAGYGQDGYAQDGYGQDGHARHDAVTGRYERDGYAAPGSNAAQDGYDEQQYAAADPFAQSRGGDPFPLRQAPGRPGEPYDEPAGYAQQAGLRGGDPPQAGDEEGWEDGPSRDGFIPGLDDRNGRRGGKRKRHVGRVLAPLLALVMLAVVGGAVYKLYPHFHTPDYSGEGTGEVTVQVPDGASAFSLAPELLQLGVVASTRAFIDAAKANSNPDGLQPGYFSLHKHMKASLAYALLLSPSSRIQTVVAIPEGLRLSQILSLLQQKAAHSVPASAYANAIKDAAALGLPAYAHGNPEGYLFPATYDVTPGESPLAVLQAMVARYNQEAQGINLASAAAAVNLTPAKVIIVASILEAEAGNPKYYAQVAEVIYNRLNDGIRLGLDSTVNYALNRFGVSLTQTQMAVNSPYNTLIHAGLPPGPIDSPGDAAIQGALHPAQGPLLYFVTVNLKTGLTLFATNAAQFNQDVNICKANHAGC